MVKKLGLYLRWDNKKIHAVYDLVLHHLEDNSILREYDNKSKLKGV